MPLDIVVRIRGGILDTTDAVASAREWAGQADVGLDAGAMGQSVGGAMAGFANMLSTSAPMLLADWLIEGLLAELRTPEGAELSAVLADLGDALLDLGATIIEPFRPVLGDILAAIVPLALALGGLVHTLLPVVQLLAGVAASVIGTGVGWVGDLAAGVSDVVDSITALGTAIGEALKAVGTAIADAIAGVAGFLGSILDGVLGWLGGVQRDLQGILDDVSAAWDALLGRDGSQDEGIYWTGGRSYPVGTGPHPDALPNTVHPMYAVAVVHPTDRELIAAVATWGRHNGGERTLDRAIPGARVSTELDGADVSVLLDVGSELPFVLDIDILGTANPADGVACELTPPEDALRDVTAAVVELAASWGASSWYGPLTLIEAGESTLTFYDPDRLLDPGNADLDDPIVPGRALRIDIDGSPAWTGSVVGVTHELASQLSTVLGSDAVVDLSSWQVAVTLAAGLVTDQVAQLLTTANYPAKLWRIEGVSATSRRSDYWVGSLSEGLRRLCDAELGQLYVDRTGVVVFRARSMPDDPTVLATLGDGGIGIVDLVNETDRRIVNRVVINYPVTSTSRVYTDASSSGRYGVSSLAMSDDDLRLA